MQLSKWELKSLIWLAMFIHKRKYNCELYHLKMLVIKNNKTLFYCKIVLQIKKLY